MKNGFLKNSSQRVLFSAMMVSALVAGNVAPMHAEVTSVQSVLQSVSVKGQVLDAEGIPVIGASVLEKGTTNGVITDIDGNYSLNVSSKNAVVVISYTSCCGSRTSAASHGASGCRPASPRPRLQTATTAAGRGDHRTAGSTGDPPASGYSTRRRRSAAHGSWRGPHPGWSRRRLRRR